LAWSLAAVSAGCRDLSAFSTAGDRYEGAVVQADFVRAGVDPSARLCLTIDTDHLQDGPGSVSTTDGRFGSTPLRPIPQIWHDPLSTLSFGEGRLKNLIYVAAANATLTSSGGDVLVVVSLMQSGDVEVRLLRGAPRLAQDGGPALGSADAIFGVFDLTRQSGPCAY
jgi:hypothetical protein